MESGQNVGGTVVISEQACDITRRLGGDGVEV